MQSLTSKGYVKTQFSWQWYYYTLTPEGLDYLREYLHLPSEIVPNTHRKAQRPSRPAQVRQQGEGFRSGRDDRDSYRRADAKEGADAGYRPRFVSENLSPQKFYSNQATLGRRWSWCSTCLNLSTIVVDLISL